MKTFQYQLLRYVHDQFTGEFVLLGVVVYCPEASFLQAKVTSKYGRITALFPEANGKFVSSQIKKFETAVHRISSQLFELFKPAADLASITASILPPDNSALRLSEVEYGLDLDPATALDDLFINLVEKYIPSMERQTLSDEEVWKKKYKAYFDMLNVSNRLKNHKIKTKSDLFDFDQAWKNEIWHCYQPLSLEMQSKDTLKDKVYKWAGKLQELENAQEPLDLSFMLSLPVQYADLQGFIYEKLKHNTSTLNVKIYTENEAEELAKTVAKEMAAHDDGSSR